MKNNFSSHSHSQTATPPAAAGDDQPPEEKARCDWDFNLSAVISSDATDASNAASDAIGVLEFDQTNSLLATGGIARKIRIYNSHKFLTTDGDYNAARVLDHAAACDYYMCTPAKLSSLKWKPGSRVIGSGDYDGVVTEYDLEKRVPVFERDEHGGRRVWTIDYSGRDPNLGASGSDDGTMQMWDTRCDVGKCVASVQPDRFGCSPVCCLEFNPFGGRGEFVTVGCADRRIYGYDVRKTGEPVFILDGHAKAVTYTRFLDAQTIVSSSIDGCLAMWDVEDQRLLRRYKGHVNSRRFVGLSVWRNGGLLSCGSENNRVFVYDKRWGDPIWVRGFETGEGLIRSERTFVSGVCWRQTAEERCTLVAGDSDGVLQVFEGERKR